MRKRKAVRWISYLLAAAVALGAFAALESRWALRAERAARYQGEYAFSALCDAVSGMDAARRKTRYAFSPGMTAALCAEAYARALAASAALSSLPFSIQELEQTAGFLARTGDYAAWLLRKTGGGEDVTEEERENLRALGDAASLLADNLRQLREDRSAGEGTDAALAELPPLSDSFLQMEQEFPELPSLVYDGPFSAAVAERVPRMTEGAEEIGEEAAALVAAGFLGMRSNQVRVEGAVDGKIPVWRVTAGDWSLSVSRRGGYVVQAISSRVPTRSVYSLEEGLEAARAALRSHDYRGMEESYHVAQGNKLTVTFIGRQGDAVCYPDMVKVTVAMDDGGLLRFDAEAYLTSHALRDLPAPEADPEAMRAMLPEGLNVLSERLAVIPTPGAEEIFCREFVCEDAEGQHWLVYFNAVTGAQERILILLEDESGTLSL